NLVALLLLVLGAAGVAMSLLPASAEAPSRAGTRTPTNEERRPSNVQSSKADVPPRDPLPPNALARMGTTRFRHGASAQAVAFSRNGKLLASADWNRHLVRVWDAATGKELMRLKGHTNSVHTVAFSPDGKTLASGDRHDIRLWDVSTGKPLHVLGNNKISETFAVAFSPDGKLLASRNQHRL